MKILVVTNMYPSAQRPAYGAFVWQQVEQLRQRGHIVDIVNILGFQSKLNYLKGAIEILQKTYSVEYDVVHAHYGYTALAALWRLNAPFVITLHGSDLLGGRFESLCSRVMAKFADAVIVVSEKMREPVSGIVIPCGVDRNVFKPYNREEARARLQWLSKKYVVLFPFDSARNVKRYDLANASVELLRQAGMKIELIAISNVSNQEMPLYYSAADVMLLCSDREGSPTSIKEALACNLPIVATDVGDVRAMVAGVPGTRICTQEVVDIAQKLREILQLPRDDSFDRRTAMAKYDQALTVERLIGVYKDVLDKFRAKH